MKSAVLTLIAGANGAGKSTLTAGNAEIFSPFPLLDPDKLTRPLSGSAASPLAAGREVLHLAKGLLSRAESFTIETTLAGRNYLKMMSRARILGFEIVLVYIGTDNVEINLARIQQRVLAGGHDIPEADVRRRYQRSFENLPTAVRRADHTLLFDNSTERGYQIAGVLSPSANEWFEPMSRWAASLKAALFAN